MSNDYGSDVSMALRYAHMKQEDTSMTGRDTMKSVNTCESHVPMCWKSLYTDRSYPHGSCRLQIMKQTPSLAIERLDLLRVLRGRRGTQSCPIG